jgi:hypothetical protein
VVNTGLFLVGFRVLTVGNVSLRSLLPGAVLAAPEQRVEVSFDDAAEPAADGQAPGDGPSLRRPAQSG